MESVQFVRSKAAFHVNNNDNGSSPPYLADRHVESKVGYLVAISLVIVVGNVLVITSIITVKDMRRITSCFLVSLASADLMVGTVTIPLFILWLLKHEAFAHSGFCHVVLLGSLFVTLASQLNVVAVTVERYLAVCHPFLHRRLVTTTPRAVGWSVSFVWVASAVCTALSSLTVQVERDRDGLCSYYSYFHRTFLITSVVAGVFVPFVVILCLNVRIVMQVRLSTLFTQSMYQPATSRRQSTTSWSGGAGGGALSKATKTVVVVCCLYLAAWTPFFAVVVKHTVVPSRTLHANLDLVLLFAFANSACNPIVYALCNLHFCRASRRLQRRVLGALGSSRCFSTRGCSGCCCVRPADGPAPRLGAPRKDSMAHPLRRQSAADKREPPSHHRGPEIRLERSQV